MIGSLPTYLIISNKKHRIRTDYRICLHILKAFQDPNLCDYDKSVIMLKCLYIDFPSDDDIPEALNKAIWFLNCDNAIESAHNHNQPQLYDWEQDEQMIFSSVNKVAGKEVRTVEYMHFWTFYGLFSEVGEGTFSHIVSIRNKKHKGVKLDKSEQEYYRDHKDIIDIKKYSEKDKEELELVRELLSLNK